jgi:hypothetical protein
MICKLSYKVYMFSPIPSLGSGAYMKKVVLPLKLILPRTVKYVKIIVLVSSLACAGLLAVEIQALERSVTLLRSDSKTIEKVAKRKLGMVRGDETVYIFDNARSGDVGHIDRDLGLSIGYNMP